MACRAELRATGRKAEEACEKHIQPRLCPGVKAEAKPVYEDCIRSIKSKVVTPANGNSFIEMLNYGSDSELDINDLISSRSMIEMNEEHAPPAFNIPLETVAKPVNEVKNITSRTSDTKSEKAFPKGLGNMANHPLSSFIPLEGQKPIKHSARLIVTDIPKRKDFDDLVPIV
jgi:hypothetical protein